MARLFIAIKLELLMARDSFNIKFAAIISFGAVWQAGWDKVNYGQLNFLDVPTEAVYQGIHAFLMNNNVSHIPTWDDDLGPRNMSEMERKTLKWQEIKPSEATKRAQPAAQAALVQSSVDDRNAQLPAIHGLIKRKQFQDDRPDGLTDSAKQCIRCDAWFEKEEFYVGDRRGRKKNVTERKGSGDGDYSDRCKACRAHRSAQTTARAQEKKRKLAEEQDEQEEQEEQDE
ncbi:hypothetical protein BC567DRAFT_286384 [Phyllosticta citribraziliensis]